MRGTLAFRGFRPRDNVPRKREHIRADPQASVVSRAHIHLELQLAFFNQEIDGAATCQKIRSFANSENVCSLDSLEDSSVSLDLGMTDKEDVASAQVSFLVEPSNFDLTPTDGSATRNLRQ